jgi:putative peptide zinc metalloprotease protein
MKHVIKGHPRLRQDLQASEYRESDGTETVILKEPVTEKFFRLSLFEYDLLKALDGSVSVEQALQRLKSKGLSYTPEEAGAIISRAAQYGLLLGTKVHTASYMTALKGQLQKAKSAQRLSSYYFFSLPLLNPDNFLTRTVWIFNLLCNRWTAGLLAVATPVAVYLIFAGLPRIEHEYLFFFHWKNILYLWIMIVLTKLIHEFSHAYTAKRFGLHVPQMGVAFLLFLPCLFCNTTDAWQLADRKQRMAISAAGILAELVLACVATFIWYFTRPGVINSLAFYLMTISLVSTIVFNANPLIKFDGYFILMDYLRIPNLSAKAIEHLKHLFMNRVMGISQVTTSASSGREYMIFTVYGVCAFAYRIILYTGIVAGVYYRFDKFLGILLAVPAAWLFTVRPLVRGAKTLYDRRSQLQPRVSGIVTFVLLVSGVIGFFFCSWPRHTVYRCYVGPQEAQKITVPLPIPISRVFVEPGSIVKTGEVLFTLDTAQLELTLAEKIVDREIVSKEIELLLLSDGRKAQADGKRIELLKVEDEIERTREKLALASQGIIAPFDGVVTSLDPRMQEGFKPGEGTIVGEMEGLTGRQVHALIPEDDLEKIHSGQSVKIWLPLNHGQIFTRPVVDVKPYSETNLQNSPFSSRFGGEVATEAKGENELDAPLNAYYTCSVGFPDGADLPLGMTGKMIVASAPRSMASRLMHNLILTFNRESLL